MSNVNSTLFIRLIYLSFPEKLNTLPEEIIKGKFCMKIRLYFN